MLDGHLVRLRNGTRLLRQRSALRRVRSMFYEGQSGYVSVSTIRVHSPSARKLWFWVRERNTYSKLIRLYTSTGIDRETYIYLSVDISVCLLFLVYTIYQSWCSTYGPLMSISKWLISFGLDVCLFVYFIYKKRFWNHYIFWINLDFLGDKIDSDNTGDLVT